MIWRWREKNALRNEISTMIVKWFLNHSIAISFHVIMIPHPLIYSNLCEYAVFLIDLLYNLMFFRSDDSICVFVDRHESNVG